MPIIRVHSEESGDIRPGDAVFHWQGDNKWPYPLHAGIYVGTPQAVDGTSSLPVVGIPSGTLRRGVGEAQWGGASMESAYQVSIVGTRKDQSTLALNRAALIAQSYSLDTPRVPEECSYGKIFLVREDESGVKRFVAGSCAHFVNFVYAQAEMPLIRYNFVQTSAGWGIEFEMRNPDNPKRVYPACLIRAFHCDTYPLREEWQDALEFYPDCLTSECPSASASTGA